MEKPRYLPGMPALRRIRLRPWDRRELEGWVRARTTPQRRVERARIILGSAGRFGRSGLAREIGVSLPTTTPEVEAEVVRRTLEEKPSRGTHWSTRLMAECMGLHHS